MGDRVPVLLLGNKADNESEREVPRSHGEQLAKVTVSWRLPAAGPVTNGLLGGSRRAGRVSQRHGPGPAPVPGDVSAEGHTDGTTGLAGPWGASQPLVLPTRDCRSLGRWGATHVSPRPVLESPLPGSHVVPSRGNPKDSQGWAFFGRLC